MTAISPLDVGIKRLCHIETYLSHHLLLSSQPVSSKLVSLLCSQADRSWGPQGPACPWPGLCRLLLHPIRGATLFPPTSFDPCGPDTQMLNFPPPVPHPRNPLLNAASPSRYCPIFLSFHTW